MSGAVTLILGGARSGKSAYAERLASGSGRPVLYVATATAGDEEMAARIAAHRMQRPQEWRTVEAPYNLWQAVHSNAQAGDAILIDCLTLWVSNVLLRELGDAAEVESVPAATWTAIEAALSSEVEALIADAREWSLALLLVSNEVGMGVVPAFPLGRRFQDILGRVNQAVASKAEAVVLMIAGLPVDVRRLST